MEFKEFISNNKQFINEGESKNYNVLVFAFVGDAVFTLYVRELLATTSTSKAGVLHTKTSKIVKAGYQANLYDILEMSVLDDEEKMIGKSARNSHTNNIAKHSSLDEYKKATSFEAVIGYLYMTNKTERLNKILDICKEQIMNK